MKDNKCIKLLLLEHDQNDIELLLHELKKGGIDFIPEIAEDKQEFREALENFSPDIILSDYSLPSFDGSSAFRIAQQLCPRVPFIIVSGAIGEENAVELIKNGVTDYCLKDKLFLITPKINRALKEAKELHEKSQAKEALIRERIEHQRNLANATIEGQEKEKAEIGKELHDNINQILVVTKAYIDASLGDDEMKEELLKRSLHNLEHAIDEIRKISKSLVPPVLANNGLVESVNTLIENIQLVKPFKINFRCNSDNMSTLSEKQQLALYRIIQEQFNNIIKHSGASNVLVELTQFKNLVSLVISDNGKGFDPRAKRNGVGLNNIISRIELLEGELEVISSNGAGCTLKIHLPKKQELASLQE